MSNVNFNFDGAESQKSMSEGELWDPASKTVIGPDGKSYKQPLRDPDPNNKDKVGYYLRTERFMNQKYGKETVIHLFKGTDDKLWKIFGTTALDKQVARVVDSYGPGYLCCVRFHGRKIKKEAVNKPKELLEKNDFYKDFEVLVDTSVTPIEVAGTPKPTVVMNTAMPTNNLPNALPSAEPSSDGLPW